MQISKAIAEFEGLIDAAKAELAEVTGKITALEAERAAIERAQPHTDDIVAVFLRGLKQAEGDFERQFTSHLASHFVGLDSAQAVGPTKSAGIVRMEPKKPSQDMVISRSMGHDQATINATVLTYFLRDKIAEEIPALVERLCPTASNGMKGADRQRALREIEAKLAVLNSERDALNSNLIAARSVVR